MFRLRHQWTALWNARALLVVLARREFSARYAGSAGGVLWAYAQPMLMVAAYYLVFDVVFQMRLGAEAPTKAVGTYLIVGMVPWIAFCDAIGRAMNSLTDSATLLQKNPLPLVLFPVRSVLASALVFMPLMTLLIALYSPLHRFGPAVLSIVPLLLLQTILCAVLGYLLAIFNAALRDTAQLVTFALAVGVFVSPVLFPKQMFPADWQWVLWLNPMSAFVQSYQSILLQGHWPEWSHLAVVAAWIVVPALILNQALNRSADQLVDWL